jgi:hypothetical protein
MLNPIQLSLSRSRKIHLGRFTHSAIEALEKRTFLSATLSGTTLNITGTSAADTFTLSDDGTNITVVQGASTSTFNDSAVAKVVVNPSAGGDTVNLLSNTKPVAINGGGLDNVNIGNAGDLQGIAAAVTVGNAASFTNLSLDGTGEPGGETGTLTPTTITGLSPGTVSYTAARLSGLRVAGPFNISVTNTGVLHNSAPTIVAGAGINASVLATTGALTVDVTSGGNAAIGNNGSTQGIKGNVIVNNDPIVSSSLSIDDSADTVGRTVNVDSDLNITGVAPATISYPMGWLDDSELDLTLGKGNDNLTLNGAAWIRNVINTGAGNDTITVNAVSDEETIYGGDGNDAFIVGDGNAPDTFVVLDGGAGSNTLVVNDSDSPYDSPYSINSNGVSFSDAGNISLSGAQKISLFAGAGNNAITVDPLITIPVLIHGGAGNDLIYGGPKNDTIYGDAGDDTIYGNGGDDSLFGNDGNDSLNGGPGNDILTGGSGIDTLNDGEDSFVHIIADNVGSEGETVTGAWTSSTSSPGFYNTNYFTDGNTGKGTKSITWSPVLPIDGSYQVYARWTAASNRSNHVPFKVVHQGTTSTVYENQQQNNNAWVLLGTYTFNSGTGASVTISNAGTTGYVIADAVRFIPKNVPASITGNVFNDINGNGKQDAGEGPSVTNPSIYIDTNLDGIQDDGEPSVGIDASGNYTFTGLTSGTYRLRENNASGVRHTAPGSFYQDVTVHTSTTLVTVHAAPFGDQRYTPNPAPTLAIDAGGYGFTLNSGISFGQEYQFTGGTAVTTPFDVLGTDNDPLFYSYRTDPSTFNYHVFTNNGTYNLVLWFVDPTSTAAGQRKFNVTVEGKQVLTNFDIVATAGVKTAVSKTIPITISNGQLDMSFDSVVGSPILSAFALYPT